jgi:hypothetical protein
MQIKQPKGVKPKMTANEEVCKMARGVKAKSVKKRVGILWF